ncbi:uncharacterized protein METZ01_LOCUS272477, partial [marine metagenome]
MVTGDERSKPRGIDSPDTLLPRTSVRDLISARSGQHLGCPSQVAGHTRRRTTLDVRASESTLTSFHNIRSQKAREFLRFVARPPRAGFYTRNGPSAAHPDAQIESQPGVLNRLNP